MLIWEDCSPTVCALNPHNLHFGGLVLSSLGSSRCILIWANSRVNFLVLSSAVRARRLHATAALGTCPVARARDARASSKVKVLHLKACTFPVNVLWKRMWWEERSSAVCALKSHDVHYNGLVLSSLGSTQLYFSLGQQSCKFPCIKQCIRMGEGHHIACGSCLRNLPSLVCPNCDGIYEEDEDLSRFASLFKVDCSNDGCDMSGDLLEYFQHEATCPHAPTRR